MQEYCIKTSSKHIRCPEEFSADQRAVIRNKLFWKCNLTLKKWNTPLSHHAFKFRCKHEEYRMDRQRYAGNNNYYNYILRILILGHVYAHLLTFTILWTNSADGKLVHCLFLFYPENRFWNFMQIVSETICIECHSLFSEETKKVLQNVVCSNC